jgi:hypothetical protein
MGQRMGDQYHCFAEGGISELRIRDSMSSRIELGVIVPTKKGGTNVLMFVPGGQ